MEEIESIDWENMEKHEIKRKIHEVQIKAIQGKLNSSKGDEKWKLKKYPKISQFQEKFNEKQPYYLNWESLLTIVFKLKPLYNDFGQRHTEMGKRE
ncbi:hypothetical protein M0813_07390 [Anaeramoeba flamelloides]|uniref:Uncharacterized protein n=1 Tax=Anaeramoeba flamelloides TaxID=1746091 RepID=A0ABQ8XCM6_9EUKA|nr:hypothetical protein M0813_07390 [Anaeramoeba flamelloides]